MASVLQDNSGLKITPLGGLGEIGLNMMLFEYGDDIIVVDCGLMFPEPSMLGIDLVVPDITALAGRAADICVFDPQARVKVSREPLKSQGKNTPFIGYELVGRVRTTIVAGKPVFQQD